MYVTLHIAAPTLHHATSNKRPPNLWNHSMQRHLSLSLSSHLLLRLLFHLFLCFRVKNRAFSLSFILDSCYFTPMALPNPCRSDYMWVLIEHYSYSLSPNCICAFWEIVMSIRPLLRLSYKELLQLQMPYWNLGHSHTHWKNVGPSILSYFYILDCREFPHIPFCISIRQDAWSCQVERRMWCSSQIDKGHLWETLEAWSRLMKYNSSIQYNSSRLMKYNVKHLMGIWDGSTWLNFLDQEIKLCDVLFWSRRPHWPL